MKFSTMYAFQNTNVIKIVLVILAVLALFFSSTSSASAISSPSYLYNNKAGQDWVPMYYAPNARSSNIKAWYRDSTKFWMQCYVIQSTYPYTGNYTSTMWFWGLGADGNWGYINSSWVYWQISVPRC